MKTAGDVVIERAPGEAPPLPDEALIIFANMGRRAIPAIAKNRDLLERLLAYAQNLPSRHRLLLGDSRQRLGELPDESVHLALTSPPYWTLKEYAKAPASWAR